MGVLLLMAEHKETLAVKVRWAEVVVAEAEVVPAKEGKMAVAEPVETAETAKYQTSRGPSYITPVAAAARVTGLLTFKDGVVLEGGVMLAGRQCLAPRILVAVAVEVHGMA